MTREEVIQHIEDRYGVKPDYPWARTPNYAIFRHKKNRKWFGALMDITADKLGLDSEELVDAINLKCEPEILGSIRDGIDVFPAYHMNKEHWITVLISGAIDAQRLYSLIDMSYELTQR